MTCDMWWGVNIQSKFQLPSSHGLKERQCFEDISTKDHSVSLTNTNTNTNTNTDTESISDGGVFRTAPATLGL